MEVDGDVGALRAFEAIVELPRASDLAAVARAVTTRAFEARRRDVDASQVTRLADEIALERVEGDTPFGNALDVLEHGPEDDAQRALACALTALVLTYDPPTGRDDEEHMAERTLWLAANTAFDATSLLDRALGATAGALWVAIANRIRSIDADRLPSSNRGQAIVGALALSSSRAKEARRELALLQMEIRDPKVQRIFRNAPRDPPKALTGEIVPAPRGSAATTALALSGILLVMHLVRSFARVALGYRRPAAMTLAEDGGVRVRWRVEVLGRVLREAELFVPRGGLLRVVRDVRYPKLALYAGLLALSVGSLIGVSAFVDGARVLSPSLLAAGLAIVTLGLALDFALSSLAQGARGDCRVLIVPRSGSAVCIGRVDISHADELLLMLVDR
jgi:hypothetical protein